MTTPAGPTADANRRWLLPFWAVMPLAFCTSEMVYHWRDPDARYIFLGLGLIWASVPLFRSRYGPRLLRFLFD